jgi:hypothetical protein
MHETGTVIRRQVDGGSKQYWREQREGFVKVTRLHEAFVLAEQNGWVDRMDAALIESASHPGAVRILRAFGLRMSRPYFDSYPALLNEKGRYATAREIPVFGKASKKQ